jgi:RNA polymerase sigma-70 factor (ECF subfamily)
MARGRPAGNESRPAAVSLMATRSGGGQESETPSLGGRTDPEEGRLLTRAQGGDTVAFEQVVKQYQRRVYGVAYRIVRRHDVADDVAQEAFIRAFRALASFDPGRPFGPWISRIAANLAINHVRSPEAREEELPDGHAETPSRGEDPLDRVLDSEARAILHQALASLPAEQRAVFVLRAVEGLSYLEIAESLQISIGTVMSRLSRAREKLRTAVAPYLGGAALRASGGEG